MSRLGTFTQPVDEAVARVIEAAEATNKMLFSHSCQMGENTQPEEGALKDALTALREVLK